jgi:hypothetical protein
MFTTILYYTIQQGDVRTLALSANFLRTQVARVCIYLVPVSATGGWSNEAGFERMRLWFGIGPGSRLCRRHKSLEHAIQQPGGDIIAALVPGWSGALAACACVTRTDVDLVPARSYLPVFLVAVCTLLGRFD